VQHRGAGIALQQLPRRARRFQVAAALVLDDRDQVEDVLVVRTQELGALDLAPGGLVLPLRRELARLGEVDEEEALVDRGKVTRSRDH
jgi:hypothetical protein